MALRHLALPDKTRLLWVDAVCINQSDDTEKSKQVQRMRAIYSQAASVIIWLGKANQDIQIMFEGLQRLQDLLSKEVHTIELAKVLWPTAFKSQNARAKAENGLQILLHRPWFQRVWILQEVALARHASVHAGWTTIPADVFALAAQLTEAADLWPRPYWLPVITIMPGIGRETSWWAFEPDLHTLLDVFHQSRATDCRDMVYALLRLSWDDLDREAIVPDYARPMHEVFQEVLQYFLRSEESDGRQVLDLTAKLPNIATVLVVVEEYNIVESRDGAEYTIAHKKAFWRHQSRVSLDEGDGQSARKYSDLLILPIIPVENAHIRVEAVDRSSGQSRGASLYSEVTSLLTLSRQKDSGPLCHSCQQVTAPSMTVNLAR
ncbi:putative heterokaryon incompatibility [Septoria linicola]|nr:putative heterokaryon incompatibility [Septoria linicola]